MTARRLITPALLLLACSPLTRSSWADDTDKIPEACRPFIDTVDRCQRYDTMVGRKGWKTEFRLAIGKSGKVKEATIVQPKMHEQMTDRMLKYTAADGANAIAFNIFGIQPGLLQVGPEVSGEFAVEMRAKSVSDRLNDLSIVCDAVGQSPAFQFGGFDNTRNVLYVGDDPAGAAATVEGDAGVTIQRNAWHRVRLEVRKDEIVGLVDGRVVARGKPTPTYDFAKKRQPLIYIYASNAVISDYRIDRPVEVDVDLDKAWKDAFVHKTREQVMSDLTELAKLLNDPAYETRQSAHGQLARAGTLAEPALRAAASAGALEGRERAKSLLRLLGVQISEE